MKQIYLDHNATTPIREEVLQAMLPYFKTEFGNASSLYTYGKNAKAGVEEAREKVARVLGCSPSEVIFTGSGTEADNFAIKGFSFANRNKGNHIITSGIEHHAVLNTCKYIETQGFQVSYLPVDEYGIVDPEDVRKCITSKTILISVMHANNEVGTIQPISEIGKIARESGIAFHTDAVQTFGKLRTKVEELNVDMLSLSAHKIYGPKGVGALYVKKGVKIDSLLHGGGHERGRRAGTENVAGIVGLGVACELAEKEREGNENKIRNLRNLLEEKILKRISEVRLNGHPVKRTPQTLSCCFKYVEGESIILSLDLKGISVSSGSACTSGAVEPSHVLLAMGIPPDIAQGSIRFSLGWENTEEEIEITVEEMAKTVEKLRAMSPLYAR